MRTNLASKEKTQFRLLVTLQEGEKYHKWPISQGNETFSAWSSWESPLLNDFFLSKSASNLEHSWTCAISSFIVCKETNEFSLIILLRSCPKSKIECKSWFKSAFKH